MLHVLGIMNSFNIHSVNSDNYNYYKAATRLCIVSTICNKQPHMIKVQSFICALASPIRTTHFAFFYRFMAVPHPPSLKHKVSYRHQTRLQMKTQEEGEDARMEEDARMGKQFLPFRILPFRILPLKLTYSLLNLYASQCSSMQ